MTNLLNQHHIICWDVDSTLINGRNSDFFQEYVVNNPKKEHHIVTFRSDPVDIYNLSSELHIPHKNFSSDLFKSIQTMPQDMCIENIDSKIMQNIILNINDHHEDDVFKYTGITKQQLLNKIKKCHYFKADACIKVGSKILIDDLYKQLLPSFIEKKLTLVDSLRPLFKN